MNRYISVQRADCAWLPARRRGFAVQPLLQVPSLSLLQQHFIPSFPPRWVRCRIPQGKSIRFILKKAKFLFNSFDFIINSTNLKSSIMNSK